MRLIDADELVEHAWRDKLDSRELIAKMIDNAPTIKEIPTKIPIDIFEKLVSQETRWIPVSEKSPETDEDVLVTNGRGMYIGWIDATDKGWRTNSEDEYFMDDVIAWMPLPKPYKAESEE